MPVALTRKQEQERTGPEELNKGIALHNSRAGRKKPEHSLRKAATMRQTSTHREHRNETILRGAEPSPRKPLVRADSRYSQEDDRSGVSAGMRSGNIFPLKILTLRNRRLVNKHPYGTKRRQGGSH